MKKSDDSVKIARYTYAFLKRSMSQQKAFPGIVLNGRK